MRTVVLGCVLLAASIASATPTYVATVTGTSGGLPVSAEADFTFGTGTLMLTLQNLTVNPTGVAQNISDFSFTIAPATVGTLTSSSAATIAVADNGSFASAGTVNPVPWAFMFNSGVFTLDDLGAGGAGPADTIIGFPGGSTYSNANDSIAKTGGPHNPFIYQSATWNFSIPGVSPSTTPTSIIFSFGTTPGDDIIFTPEPGSWLLLGTGLAALFLVARRTARKRTA
jgi:PEP-CTERM motif